MGHGDAFGVAGGRIHVQAEALAGFDADRALGKDAQAQLGALQIGQYAQGPVHDDLCRADVAEHLRVGLVRAVAEVQAEHVDPGAGQGQHLLGGVGGRTEGRDDTAAPIADHGTDSCCRIGLWPRSRPD